MNWLTDLLKHLKISRSLIGAVFVTTLVLFVGPRLKPNLVESVPKEWTWVVFAALVFSGVLLFFWACAATWSFTRKLPLAVASATLSQQEADLLLGLSVNPNTPLDLESIDYAQTAYTHLEMIETASSLHKKGLVELNEWDPRVVYLTPAGRERALELQQRRRRRP